MRRFVITPCVLLACVLLWPSEPAGGQDRPKKKKGRPGEIITPAAKGERLRDTLKVGDPAPDFTLRELGGDKRPITLSSFRGRQPVVLVFGSYT